MDLVEISIAAAIFTMKLTLFIYIGLFVANIACKREKILRLGIIFNPLVRLGEVTRMLCILFLAVWCAIGLIETMMGVIYGRARLSKSLQERYPEGNYRFDVPTPKKEDFKQELKEASKDSFGTLVKIVKILAPVIFILCVIIIFSICFIRLSPIMSLFLAGNWAYGLHGHYF